MSARVEHLTSQPWDTRVQFRTDAFGRTFSYRPNQLITVRAAVHLVADRVPKLRDGSLAQEDVFDRGFSRLSTPLQPHCQLEACMAADAATSAELELFVDDQLLASF